LRLDGSTGMSVWWRDHADHHMGVLLSADGLFKGLQTRRRWSRNKQAQSSSVRPSPQGPLLRDI
jgi:hypothetical protein